VKEEEDVEKQSVSVPNGNVKEKNMKGARDVRIYRPPPIVKPIQEVDEVREKERGKLLQSRKCNSEKFSSPHL